MAPARILVVTPVFGVGNLVLLTGLLANLRRLHPGAHVTVALPAAPYVASILGPELADALEYFEPRSPRRALAFAWRTLRPRRFDLGLATFFFPWWYASALLLAAGCRARVACAPDARRGVLNTVTCFDGGGHELDRHLQLLAFAGASLERTTRLVPGAEARAWADAAVGGLRTRGAARLVGIHPGCEAVNRQKRWPAERFGELARRLAAHGDVGVLVFVGPGEEDVLPALGLADGPRVHVVRGEELARVIALVARCDAFVSNDSGLMHMAAALDVPVAAVFGPTPLDKNAPVGRAVVVEQEGVWCRPCWAGPPLTCHRERRHCLEDITVEQVLAAALSLLPEAGGVRREGA